MVLGRCVKTVAVFLSVVTAATVSVADVTAPSESSDHEMMPLIEGQTALGLDLLKSLAGEIPPTSGVVLSPVSIHEAMWLVRLGADGATAQELDRILLTSGSATALRALYGELNDEVFQSGKTVAVELGNSLWVNSSIRLRAEYEQLVTSSMRATVRAVDFTQPTVKDEINSFVSRVTHGLIPRLLAQPPAPGTIATLVNALYVKGGWGVPFKKELTRPEDFWLSKNLTVKRDMMHLSEAVSYLEVPGWQAATLNFGMGQLSFSVFLPRQKLSPQEIVSSMNHRLIAQAFSESRYEELEIALPRMKLSSRPPLKTRLETRAPMAFTSKADFSKLSESPLMISDVIHESVVTVDEQGVEAAAASAVMMVKSAAPGNEKPRVIPFVVDHPFAFVISHRHSRAPLFIGVVADPGE